MAHVILTIGGVDFTPYLVSFERHVGICDVACTSKIELDDAAPQTDPGYTEVIVDVDGTRKFTGYISSSTCKRAADQYIRELFCDHKALKRMKDRFLFDPLNASGRHVSSVLAEACGWTNADCDYTYTASTDPYTPDPYEWHYVNIMQCVADLLLFGGIQCIPHNDGSVEFTDISVNDVECELDASDIRTSCERRGDDSFFRTQVYLFGDYNIAVVSSGSNPYGYDRNAVVANPMVQSEILAQALADAMLDEFNQLVTTHKLGVTGIPDIRQGQFARYTDHFDGTVVNKGIVTAIDDRYNEDNGYATDITLNERCPKIWGFDYNPQVYYTHKPLAVCSEVNGVYVTPNICLAFSGLAGTSGSINVGNSCEWYQKNITEFPSLPICTSGSAQTRPYMLVRDVTPPGRGAWLLTRQQDADPWPGHLWYCPDLLPPATQTSGSWASTPWVLQGTYPDSDGESLVYIQRKYNDIAKIYGVFKLAGTNKVATLYQLTNGVKSDAITFPSDVTQTNNEHSFRISVGQNHWAESHRGGLPLPHWFLLDIDTATEIEGMDDSDQYYPRYLAETASNLYSFLAGSSLKACLAVSGKTHATMTKLGSLPSYYVLFDGTDYWWVSGEVRYPGTFNSGLESLYVIGIPYPTDAHVTARSYRGVLKANSDLSAWSKVAHINATTNMGACMTSKVRVWLDLGGYYVESDLICMAYIVNPTYHTVAVALDGATYYTSGDVCDNPINYVMDMDD